MVKYHYTFHNHISYAYIYYYFTTGDLLKRQNSHVSRELLPVTCNSLDHLLFVSIDFLPNFNLLGYEEGVSIRNPILVPTNTEHKSIFKLSRSLGVAGNQIKLMWDGRLRIGSG